MMLSGRRAIRQLADKFLVASGNPKIVVLAIGHGHEGWHRSTVVVEIMQLDRALPFAETGPWENGQAQVYDGGI